MEFSKAPDQALSLTFVHTHSRVKPEIWLRLQVNKAPRADYKSQT